MGLSFTTERIMVNAFARSKSRRRYIPIDAFEWEAADKCARLGLLCDNGFGEYEITGRGLHWLSRKVLN